ncbi:hypothetical protein F5Y17DRAFT_454290 [Xylariaceae sp. FL0594]|nr:hypothetical protein F5Y17DRAFT_454290 [Xylariaceae sp. FL0594]
MKVTHMVSWLGLVASTVLASAFVVSDPEYNTREVDYNDVGMLQPRTLGKRDAYSCYGSDANTSHCQGAIDQIRKLGDQELQLYSGLCLNWPEETCNVRFCSQPWIAKTVERTASWLFEWANSTLMDCAREGQYALMGDSANLLGNGGTYRFHIEPKASQND